MASRSARPTRGCAGWWAGAEVGQRGSRRPCCRPRSTTPPGTRTSSCPRAPRWMTPSPPWRPPATGPGSRRPQAASTGQGAAQPGPEADPEDVEVRSLRQRLNVSAALTAPVLALAMIPAVQFTYWQWRRCRAAWSRRVRPAGLPGTPTPGRRRALGRGPGLAARVSRQRVAGGGLRPYRALRRARPPLRCAAHRWARDHPRGCAHTGRTPFARHRRRPLRSPHWSSSGSAAPTVTRSSGATRSRAATASASPPNFPPAETRHHRGNTDRCGGDELHRCAAQVVAGRKSLATARSCGSPPCACAQAA